MCVCHVVCSRSFSNQYFFTNSSLYHFCFSPFFFIIPHSSLSLSSVLSPLVLLLWFICFLSSPPSLLSTYRSIHRSLPQTHRGLPCLHQLHAFPQAQPARRLPDLSDLTPVEAAHAQQHGTDAPRRAPPHKRVQLYHVPPQ